MERLVQGPINPCFHEEHVDVGAAGFLNTFTFEEEGEGEGEGEPNNYISSSLLDGNNMPFLQMLLHDPSLFPLTEPNFQTLLRLQHLKNKPRSSSSNNENEKARAVEIQGMDQLESCVTQDVNAVEKESERVVVRRKRKRQRPAKNKEDVESQRMTHIAVERNRRRQMNDHLTALRSLMPASYVQRGDQASIIGGAIDFVKELEQLLYSLEEHKRMKLGITKPEARAEKKSEAANIEVTVIQEHVNLKMDCRTRSGHLVRAITALEQHLRLTVLHLNITASPSQHTVLYSFNLKMEEDCGVRSAGEIASAVQQILMNNDSDNEIEIEKGFS